MINEAKQNIIFFDLSSVHSFTIPVVGSKIVMGIYNNFINQSTGSILFDRIGQPLVPRTKKYSRVIQLSSIKNINFGLYDKSGMK